MGEQVVLPGTELVPADDRPTDLMTYDDAAVLVDRSRNTIRHWARAGQLKSWAEVEGDKNSRRLVSRAAVLALAVQTGKAIHPGGPGRNDPPPAEIELRVCRAELEGARAELTATKGMLESERSRAAVLTELVETERLRVAEWKDRADALSAELTAVRALQGLPWWKRLLSTT